ncbi:hypothetical protein [Streptomyces sp. NPDC001985]|uniref:hypothetical protein n=1 Tax=Streptomyces sp. NPDC001985 TaxID=3154406 RepID=UPI0033297052
MTASAHLLLSAITTRAAADEQIPGPRTLSGKPSAHGPLSEKPWGPGTPLMDEPPAFAPLTSEPPLPDAAPLTSEPPLSGIAPLTSEPTAAGFTGGSQSPGV